MDNYNHYMTVYFFKMRGYRILNRLTMNPSMSYCISRATDCT